MSMHNYSAGVTSLPYFHIHPLIKDNHSFSHEGDLLPMSIVQTTPKLQLHARIHRFRAHQHIAISPPSVMNRHRLIFIRLYRYKFDQKN